MLSLPECSNGNAILMFLNGYADEVMVYYMSDPKRPFRSTSGEPIHVGVPSRESPPGPFVYGCQLPITTQCHTLRTSYE